MGCDSNSFKLKMALVRRHFYYIFLLVSTLVVSVTGVDMVLVLSVVTVVVETESALVASLVELQPAAIDPIIVAPSAKLKICFFIGALIKF